MPKYGCDDFKIQFNAVAKILKNDSPYFIEDDLIRNNFREIFEEVYWDLISQHNNIESSYYSRSGVGFINLMYLDHLLVFFFRLANALYKNNICGALSDSLYHSSRIRASADVYYKANIGKYFLSTHSIGAVIDSRATYGIGFRLYNGVHIGPYGIDGKNPDQWVHPKIGDGVIAYANSRIYGNTIIGDNVTLSPGSVLINEDIPNSCIVYGASPNLIAIPNKQNNLRIFNND